MRKFFTASYLQLAAVIFGLLSLFGYLILIQYPNRLLYNQLHVFNGIAAGTLISSVVGILLGVFALKLACLKSVRKSGCIIAIAISVGTIVAIWSTPRLMVKSVTTAQDICVNQCRRIDEAKNVWAEKNNATNGTEITWDELTPYFSNGFPKCPEGGTYLLGKVGQNVNCSIQSHRLPY